jgi:O-antigen ligase
LIVPLAVPRGKGIGRLVAVAAVCVMAAAAAVTVVPESTWNRIATTGQEITEGTMDGRKGIWIGAWRAFQERPLLGFGAGAFRTAVAATPLPVGQHYPHNTNPHNAFLAVLVEQGLVGFAIFGLLVAICVARLWVMPSSDRKTAAVLMLTWFVGAMSLGWQYRKPTWLLFGLLAAQASVAAAPAGRLRRSRAHNDDPGVFQLAPAPIRQASAQLMIGVDDTRACVRPSNDEPIGDLVGQLVSSIRTLQSQMTEAFESAFVPDNMSGVDVERRVWGTH